MEKKNLGREKILPSDGLWASLWGVVFEAPALGRVSATAFPSEGKVNDDAEMDGAVA